MELQILLFSLFISAALPLLVLGYLRAVLHKLLGSVCGNTDAADFWFRCLQILALSGSIILVIGFVPLYAGENWVQVVRTTLILTSIGIFAAVAIVARSIWLSVVKPAIQAQNTHHSSYASGGVE
jgi:D-alanyl-lipoteichoic acid acyltransferase DltB (MBOAT superfamily)